MRPTAEAVLARALESPPRLGSAWFVAVDGPAGSGKTTLAEQLAEVASPLPGGARVVHMDDLYQGWGGLPLLGDRIVTGILAPLAAGRAGRYRRWDWAAGDWAEEHAVDPPGLLVLEGVGSGAREHAPYLSTLVWVEAPWELRLARGIARDGEALRPEWERWRQAEADHFMVHDTRARADVVIDGTSRD